MAVTHVLCDARKGLPSQPYGIIASRVREPVLDQTTSGFGCIEYLKAATINNLKFPLSYGPFSCVYVTSCILS